jgi:hypothetical protein
MQEYVGGVNGFSNIVGGTLFGRDVVNGFSNIVG